MNSIEYNYEENLIIIKKKLLKNISLIEKSEQKQRKTSHSLPPKTDYIEIADCFSRNERIGRKGELRFKELLEQNGVPFLYISQSPLGIDKSQVLLQDTISKRPDFLINRGYGHSSLLLDVKCLKRIGSSFSEVKEHFYLTTEEIHRLCNLERTTQLPVWIAFTDNTLIDEPKTTFYLTPISFIEKFTKSIQQQYIKDKLVFIRIPFEFLTHCCEDILFEERGYKKINPELSKKYLTLHQNNIECIERTICEVQKQTSLLNEKNIISHFNKIIKNENLIDNEVRAVLKHFMKKTTE